MALLPRRAPSSGPHAGVAVTGADVQPTEVGVAGQERRALTAPPELLMDRRMARHFCRNFIHPKGFGSRNVIVIRRHSRDFSRKVCVRFNGATTPQSIMSLRP